jgi:hypothetical protein
MNTLILLAVLQGAVAVPPIRVSDPYPGVKCPRGYSIWWPPGREFDDDKYAKCIKPIPKHPAKAVTDVSHKDHQTKKPHPSLRPASSP